MRGSSANVSPLKVVFVGEAGVGKTSLIHVLVNGFLSDELQSTIRGERQLKSFTYDNREIQLQLWDTAGTEKYRSTQPFYLRGADVGLIVFALNDRNSFLKVSAWRQMIGDAASPDVPVILIGNKADQSERQVSSSDALARASDFSAAYIETSAPTGFGLNELLQSIGDLVIHPPTVTSTETKLDVVGSQPTSCCS
jgi:small GTP-binding protein